MRRRHSSTKWGHHRILGLVHFFLLWPHILMSLLSVTTHLTFHLALFFSPCMTMSLYKTSRIHLIIFSKPNFFIFLFFFSLLSSTTNVIKKKKNNWQETQLKHSPKLLQNQTNRPPKLRMSLAFFHH